MQLVLVFTLILIGGGHSALANTASGTHSSVSIQAESINAVGDWEQFQLGTNSVYVFDPQQSDLDGPDANQTLRYRFTTAEAATYRIALLCGRITSRFDTPDPGGDSRRFGDTRNNDVYFKLIEVDNQQVIQDTTRLYVGLRNTDSNRLWWGNIFDPSLGTNEPGRGTRRAQLNLKANTEYQIEISGRGDGFMFDSISIRSDTHLRNTNAHQAPRNGMAKPPLLTLRASDVDLNQYPTMENWSRAGVEGGIPRNLQIKKIIGPQDNIQNAITQVSEMGGGVLLLKNGVYPVTQTIFLKSGVVLRGESRKGVRLESRIVRSTGGNSTVRFNNVERAGIERMTLNYEIPSGEPPQTGYYRNLPDNDTVVNGITIDRNSNNNWILGCDVLNSGNDPISVAGSHNTMTANYVEGAYNKGGGGRGYYRIIGSYNLIRGEIVKDIRHYGVLVNGTQYNVTVDSYFGTDINYHTGDFGNNLFEGNTVNLPAYHRPWGVMATGEPLFAHMPPGVNNLVVNNWTFDEKNGLSLYSQQNVVYAFEGYYGPVATNLPIPNGGRFWASAYPQIDLRDPFNEGDILEFIPAIIGASLSEK